MKPMERVMLILLTLMLGNTAWAIPNSSANCGHVSTISVEEDSIENLKTHSVESSVSRKVSLILDNMGGTVTFSNLGSDTFALAVFAKSQNLPICLDANGSMSADGNTYKRSKLAELMR
jgi:hypothetical protein